MTPFLQFRIWFRRASVGQRASTGLAVVVAVGLIAWAAVPSNNGGQSATTGINGGGASAATGATGSTSGGTTQAQGASGASAASGSTSSGSAGSGAAGSNAAGSGASGLAPGNASSGAGTGSGAATTVPSGVGSAGLPGPSTGTAGCTKKGTLKIGVVIPTAAGGSINAVLGTPSNAQEEADYQAVFDSVNAAGGVDCNNLVGDFATSDLTNPDSAEAGCLQFQQDKAFAVLGGYEPLFSDNCLLGAKIPTFDQLPIPLNSAKQYYPYYYTDYPTWDLLYKNFVGAVSKMGYFSASHKFAKMGIFYESCNPEVHNALLSDLAAIGVSGSKVVSYNLGCSSAFSPPNVIEQAVLTFKADGVTTATIDDDIADGQTISDTANAQGFKPAWILPDYGEIAVQNSSSEHPNATEFNGAVAITAGQYGAIASKLPETAATQQCDKIMTSRGLPTVYNSGDQFAGSACSLTWLLVGGLQNASAVSAAGLAAGLQKAKSIALSFPAGPNDFSAAGTTWGGEYWRPLSYSSSCQCWSVSNPTFSASFP